ncbi:MAG TPA: FAD-dependent oxidoreductase [Candidatus Dojkabacteria bacterium]|nr:FAD-dependent oxidoreductase [Candidatus Dojkabacteria bacterium]
MTESEIYDIAIVGSGPAGLTASIYASRYKLKNIVFGKLLGGTITEAHKVCNYPGLKDISGIDLGMSFYDQAKGCGGEYKAESIVNIKKDNDIFILTSYIGAVYQSKTVILALGTNRNKLNLKNEDFYLGKGLSYCATCDSMFYKDKVVAVIGGSNAATMAASMLSDVAKKVYIIYRGTELRGDQVWVEEVKSKDNIEIIYTTILIGLEGENKLERIKLSRAFNNSEYLNVDGVFVEIGSEPNIDLANKLGLELDEKGYIKVSNEQSTNMAGVWAAGDCTDASNGFNQVVTAASEGAIASNSIFSYLKKGAKSPDVY